jgi:hypothetical protein
VRRAIKRSNFVKNSQFKTSLLTGMVLIGLAACGGGSDTVSSPNSVDPSLTFTDAYSRSVAALNTVSGLQSTALLDLVDATFLDAGYTKKQMADNFAADAASLSGAIAVSLFPNTKTTNMAIKCIGTSLQCTLSGTISNSDVDTTETNFTTQVIYKDGAFHLLGDQASS